MGLPSVLAEYQGPLGEADWHNVVCSKHIGPAHSYLKEITTLHLHFYSFRGYNESQLSHTQYFEMESLPTVRQLMSPSPSLNPTLDGTHLGLNFPSPSICNLERSPTFRKAPLSSQLTCSTQLPSSLCLRLLRSPSSLPACQLLRLSHHLQVCTLSPPTP